jgi:hypothetical protein
LPWIPFNKKNTAAVPSKQQFTCRPLGNPEASIVQYTNIQTVPINPFGSLPMDLALLNGGV